VDSATDFGARAVEWFLGVPLRIAIIVVVTAVVITVARALIHRSVTRLALLTPGRSQRSAEVASVTVESESVADAPATPPLRRSLDTDELAAQLLRQRRMQRANAVASLLANTVSVFAVGIAILTILPLLGVDIAPLLASAGVLGVALGFGAQNLIKDYLSGIFMVLEDQFGVGDTVELSGVVGTVEEVTLRITRLRDLSGVVWYVRNGEILTVGNRSQGWTLAIADLPVAADTDLDKVRAVVAQLSDQMMADEELTSSLLSAPTFAGVESVSGEAMVVRVVARASATEQVTMSRTLRERLKASFDAEGITIPVMLRLPGSGGATPVR
jgi:small conductance mechanosensitive channel